jgi:hypothetical protein
MHMHIHVHAYIHTHAHTYTHTDEDDALWKTEASQRLDHARTRTSSLKKQYTSTKASPEYDSLRVLLGENSVAAIWKSFQASVYDFDQSAREVAELLGGDATASIYTSDDSDVSSEHQPIMVKRYSHSLDTDCKLRILLATMKVCVHECVHMYVCIHAYVCIMPSL